jgi:hypothetical protein
MRRFIVLAPPVLLALAFACSPAADRNDTSGTPTPDAGTKAPDAGTKVPDAGTTVTPDAGTADVPCGNVSELGSCDDTSAVFCDTQSDTLVTIDCPGEFGAGGTSECADLANFGAWCVVPSGAQCVFQTSDQNTIVLGCGTASGADSTLGCELSTGCTAATACTPVGQGQTFAAACQGSKLAIDCTPWGQPILVDCVSSAKGTGCEGNTCVGVVAGQPCDANIHCATGLTCTNGTCAATP